MHALVELVSTPSVVKHKQRGDDDERDGRLKLAYHPTYDTTEQHCHVFEKSLHRRLFCQIGETLLDFRPREVCKGCNAGTEYPCVIITGITDTTD